MASPFLIAPWRACRSRGTTRTHAMRMSSLEPEESPGHQGCDACRWHLSRCLGDERRYRHIPFSRQLLVGRAVRHHLISAPRRVRKIELVGGRAPYWSGYRYRSSDGSRRLAYTGFLLSG